MKVFPASTGEVLKLIRQLFNYGQMKIRNLFWGIVMSMFTFAVAQDAELHKEIKGNEQRYKGVFPPEVKTIAVISPASYPESARS